MIFYVRGSQKRMKGKQLKIQKNKKLRKEKKNKKNGENREILENKKITIKTVTITTHLNY